MSDTIEKSVEEIAEEKTKIIAEKSTLVMQLSTKINTETNKRKKKEIGIMLGAILNENNKQYKVKRCKF